MTDVHAIDLAHAKLSASGSGKWLVCTPSAQLESQFEDTESAFSQEGTLAHELFEKVLNAYLGVIPNDDVVDLTLERGISQDMFDHVSAAAAVAIEKIEATRVTCPDAVILVERRLDFSPWVPEGFGTGDVVIIADGVTEICDLKYGKGISVYAEGNSQMRLYGLGAYNELAHLYDIQTIRTTVLQPRLENYSTEELSVRELLDWAEQVVAPQALLAWEGQGELVAGDHCHNYFCRARAVCPARAAQANELVEASFALLPPDMLNNTQLAKVLDRGDQVIKWINDIKDWALKRAEKGDPVPGYKLVEGRSNRKYKDPDAVAAAVIKSGIDEALIYERSLLGLTAMEKLLGKKKFTEILGDQIEKPTGKPTLVPESDKRPAFDALAYFTKESQED
jgi:hypothetical protein